MNNSASPSRFALAWLAGIWLLIGAATYAHATPTASDASAQPTAATAPEPPTPPAVPMPPEPMPPWVGHHIHVHSDENGVIGIGHDATLASGQKADAVVSIFGTARSDGDVSDTVVSVLGETHVTGTVGDAAVAVLGNNYVDGKVGGDVVAVLGNLELGPHAEIGGQAVSVGGVINADPQAIVRGGTHNVAFGGPIANFHWLRSWVTNCLLYGRVLAFVPGVAWAWVLALIALIFYALAALLFPEAVHRCADTLQNHPGRSLLAALLTKLGTPVVIVLLCITVIGILAIPFVAAALLIAAFFGKAVMLAWIGRHIVGSSIADRRAQAAVAVLVGGAIVMLLYTVPVVGMLTFALLGFIGLGVVMYSALVALQSRRAPAAPTGSGVPPVDGGAAPEPVAAAAALGAVAPDAPAEPPPAAASATSGNSSPSAPPAPSAATAASATTALTYPRASFWIRMGALLIDLILTGAVLHAISHHSGHVHLAVLAAYGAVMWKLRGATVGGIICHLQVVRVDGREIDWATAIVRALGCFLSLIVFGLGFIWIAIDANRQGWHDKIAGTVVVRVPRTVSLV